MEEQGYLLIVLHTHMPYIWNPVAAPTQEEDWLYEALTECYIPLVDVFTRLIEFGADFRISLSLTPCLADMLADPAMQLRYLEYLDARIALAQAEIERLQDQPELLRLARMYRERFQRWRQIYASDWDRNLLGAFRFLNDSGKVTILASAATHAYLPLWEAYPHWVAFQIQLGVAQYEKTFGRPPHGFWLPECAFYPGLDHYLHANGVKYFFLDAHGLLNGFPRPRYGVHAPVHTPAGVAAFGRDWQSHDLVWLKDKGYPGDPEYLDYERDLSSERPPEYLATSMTGMQAARTGILYRRNGFLGDNGVYHPDRAFERCDAHANHFIAECQRQVTELHSRLGRKPLLVALFDTEHFGHWWREGPLWLDLVIRKLAYDQNTVKLVTAQDYLRWYPTNQQVMPSMSSWGYQGYHETWLMGRNHWIYPQLFAAAELFDELVERTPNPSPQVRSALNQYLREFVLAQSSDWAFIMHTQTAQAYAEQRVHEHVANMEELYSQMNHGEINPGWLHSLQEKHPIFAGVDLLELYLKSNHSP
ncbi:MAG: DUF1957 domain-containing protein [Anaerolineales bacterium]|jgi:1,4-alpha-glucan branching enzyme